jgi:hypothetical protein
VEEEECLVRKEVREKEKGEGGAWWKEWTMSEVECCNVKVGDRRTKRISRREGLLCKSLFNDILSLGHVHLVSIVSIYRFIDA